MFLLGEISMFLMCLMSLGVLMKSCDVSSWLLV